MTRLLLWVAAAISGLVLAALPVDHALAQRRVALVIGNSAYQTVAPLSNTINDAGAIAALFRKAGFDIVDARQDLGVVDFKRAIREFMITARGAETAVMYYAGHGIEASGANYLIPVDAKLATDYDAEDEAVSLDRIILALEPAKRLRLVILDACRDNPFLRKMQRTLAVRSVASGLGKVEPMSTDTLIAYAAKAGSVSYDGFGPNSPFTTALIKYIAEPGVDIRIALGRVRDEVIKITESRQEPFVYGSLGGTTVSLVSATDTKKAERRPAANESDDVRSAYEATARVGTKEAWEAFLKTYGTGFYAQLARLQIAKLNPGATPESAAEQDAKARAEREQAERLALQQRQEEERRAKAAEAERLKAQREAAEADRLKTQREAAERERAERLALERRREEERRAKAAEAERLKAQREAAERERSKRLALERRQEEERRAKAAEAERLKAQREAAERERAERLALERRQEEERRAKAAEAERLEAQREVAERARAERLALERRQEEERRAKAAEAERLKAQRQAALSPRGEIESNPDQSCAGAETQLERLRANPTREEAVRFARDLKCEALRPQVNRLLESVGGESAVVAPRPTPSEHPQQPEAAPSERRESKTPVGPETRQNLCQREEERLAQLRANPAREAVARFARELACEDLRPQVLRLLESVGG
jgi:uncharacterized caspase-like protein